MNRTTLFAERIIHMFSTNMLQLLPRADTILHYHLLLQTNCSAETNKSQTSFDQGCQDASCSASRPYRQYRFQPVGHSNNRPATPLPQLRRNSMNWVQMRW